MAGEIISQFAQATSQSMFQAPPPPTLDGAQLDAAQLLEMLMSQSQQAGSAASTAPVTHLDFNTIGDAILRTLDSTGQSYKSRAAEIDKFVVDGSQLSTVDLMRLQFQLIDASLQVDLVSKAISKATQHIDQLTKLQ